MQTIERSITLAAPADRVWQAVHDPSVLVTIMAPLIAVRPVEPKIFPEQFVPATYVVALNLLGLVPLGRQALNIAHPAPEPGEALPRYVLRDQGTGDLARVWDHRIVIAPVSDMSCRYTDRVTIEAGLLTPIAAVCARLLLRHRQTRLRALAQRGFRLSHVSVRE